MKPARTVVYREVVHRFDVDGESFPWYITEEGVAFWAVAGGGYLCQLSIVVMERFEHGYGEYPFIDGRRFPWALWGPVVYSVDGGGWVPRVGLAFITDALDTDAYVGTALEAGMDQLW